MRNVDSDVLNLVIAGFCDQMLGPIVGGCGKSSLFSITVWGQLNNFDRISFIVVPRIDYVDEYSAQS